MLLHRLLFRALTIKGPVRRVQHRPTHEKRMPFFGIRWYPSKMCLLPVWSFVWTLIINLRCVCVCYFLLCQHHSFFYALNVIRFFCVGICGTMRHSCDRALGPFRPCQTSAAKAYIMTNECHFLASVVICRKCVSCQFWFFDWTLIVR